MRTLVHLSDLHFGSVDSTLLEPLRTRVREAQPHLVAVSGDLTQRAKPEQFREARVFLDTLPKPQVVVPGNHDVPLYNVFMRFFRPFYRYHHYIGENLEPEYIDEEIAVIGINTARSFTFKGGRINEEQLARVQARICHLGDTVTKIIVTHHPFDVPDRLEKGGQIIGRADMAMEALARCGVDVLLSGHLHASHTSHTVARYKIAGFSALVVQAGTATSTRLRGESNSFNILRVAHPLIRVEQYTWDPELGDFRLSKSGAFDHTPEGWITKTTSLMAHTRPG